MLMFFLPWLCFHCYRCWLLFAGCFYFYTSQKYWKISLLSHFHRGVVTPNGSSLIEPCFAFHFFSFTLANSIFSDLNTLQLVLYTAFTRSVMCECGFMGITRSANTLFAIEINQTKQRFLLLYFLFDVITVRSTQFQQHSVYFTRFGFFRSCHCKNEIGSKLINLML